MKLFSNRHYNELVNRDIRVSLKPQLRNRLVRTMIAYDDYYHYKPEPLDNLIETTSIMADVASDLTINYGWAQNIVYPAPPFPDSSDDIDLYSFLTDPEKSYPSRIFDAIESFVFNLEKRGGSESGRKVSVFVKEVNDALSDFSIQWRFVGERFFLVDEYFLSLESQSSVPTLLEEQGLSGPLSEWMRSLEHHNSGKSREAISNSAHSVESMLKTLTGEEGKELSSLIDHLEKNGFLEDIPSNSKKVLKELLRTPGIVANKLGRHGQGSEDVEIPECYSELIRNAAGAVNLFLLRKYIEAGMNQDKGSDPEGFGWEDENDIPF